MKKHLTLLVGMGALAFGHGAHAQNVLSSYVQAGTVTAGTTSYDYRYTRHTISASGRGGHTSTYYSWDPFVDQSTRASSPLPLGLTQQAVTQGSFYLPTYSATAGGSSSLTNTPTQAVLSVTYTGATTVTSPVTGHQAVTVTAQPGGTFTFTVTGSADVRVTTTGDPNGSFRLFAPGAGVILGPLYGTNGPVSLDTPLSPGTYWVTSGLTDTAGINAHAGTSVNPGSASTSWGFTMTVTPNGDSGGAGAPGGSGGSDD